MEVKTKIQDTVTGEMHEVVITIAEDGIFIHPEGFNHPDDATCAPIVFEVNAGSPRVMVWPDPSDPDACDTTSLLAPPPDFGEPEL